MGDQLSRFTSNNNEKLDFQSYYGTNHPLEKNNIEMNEMHKPINYDRYSNLY